MCQNTEVLERLKKGSLTQIQALHELGVMRLGARIYDLRAKGHVIDATMIEVTNRNGRKCMVARYELKQ